MSQRIGVEERNGRTVYHLLDDETGASASILPSYGFNLFDLRLPAAGEVRPIVYAAEGWADNPDKPGRNGIPVLFPFPNRIREGRYTFGGRSYQLPLTKPPHAIHGFTIDAPWDVADRGVGPDGASIVGRFQLSKNAPNAVGNWPADAILQMRYALKGRRLTLTVSVENPGDGPLPWGFGIHPYFRLPFPPGTDLGATSITLPASQYWELDQSLPTGAILPVDARLDFRRGRPIAGLAIDDVLTGLDFEGDQAVCRLVDTTLGAEFRIVFGRTVRELVVFTPPSPPGVIAVEPYTQTTDAINLHARGLDGGLRILEPGNSEEFAITFETVG